VDIHTSALKHGVSVEDIEHAVRNAMAIDDLEDDVRLYLAINRRERSELVIHAMPMRSKYRHLIPGE